MADNQFGRNIQHLREIRSETLTEMGNSISRAKTTTKGYENGSREPDLGTLRLMASHFNKTVDELLFSDLTQVKKMSIDWNSPRYMTELLKAIVPLFTSEEAMKSDSFQKGYKLSKELIEGFAKGEILSGNLIVRIFESYITAAEESDAPEVVANIMWSIFIWWTQIFDTQQILSLHNKLLAKKLQHKDWTKLRENEDQSIKDKRKGFVADFEEVVVAALKALKSEQEWSDLADYYLALRYVLCLVDTGLSNEMNTAVGMQMMLSFMTMGNRHAFAFCQTCLSEN